MTNIIPAPRGLWAIVEVYQDTETITFPGGATSEVGVGVPELCATPVLGFTNREDGEGNTYYPVTINSGVSFAEPLTPGDPLFEFKAYVLTKGSPFVPAGLGENVFTLDTLPEEYRFLLASPSVQDGAETTRDSIRHKRIVRVANLAHKKLASDGPLREYQVKTKLANRDRPFAREALRHLEDNGRAEYNGTHWHAVHTDTGKRG